MTAHDLLDKVLSMSKISEFDGCYYMFCIFDGDYSLEVKNDLLNRIQVREIQSSVLVSALVATRATGLEDKLTNRPAFREWVQLVLEEREPGESKKILGTL